MLLNIVAVPIMLVQFTVQEPLTFNPWTKLHKQSISSLAFGADYDRVAKRDSSFVVTASQDGTAIIWDIGMKRMRRMLDHSSTQVGSKKSLNRVRVSRDGRRIAVAGSDSRTTIWDSRTGAKLKDLSQNTGRIWDLGWSADGNKLATCDDDGRVIVWESHTGVVIRQFAPDEGDGVISALALSPDGKTVVFATRGNKAYFGNVETGARFTVVSDLAEEPTEIEFSPDGKWLAFAEQSVLVLRQGEDGKRVRGFSGHTGDIRGLQWSRDGERIVTAGDGGLIFEWNVASSRVLSRGKVAQYNNDVAICYIGGVEKFAIAKPSGIFELQK